MNVTIFNILNKVKMAYRGLESRSALDQETAPLDSLKGLEGVVYKTATEMGQPDAALNALFVASQLTSGPKGLRFVPPVNGFHELSSSEQLRLLLARTPDPAQAVNHNESLQGDEMKRALLAFREAARNAVPVKEYPNVDAVIEQVRLQVAPGIQLN